MPTPHSAPGSACTRVSPEDCEAIKAWFESPEAGAALQAAAQEARATIARMRHECRIDWRELHRPIVRILP